MKKIIARYLIVLFFLPFYLSCEKEEEIQKNPIEINATITHPENYGENTGAIDITVTGGTSPFSFIWSNNAITEDIENIPAGTYYVVVTDSRMQIKTDTFEVTQPNPIPLIISLETENPTETGSADGKIQVTLNGGIPPFSFNWSNGETTQNLENITAGSYILTITDNSNQSLTDTISLFDKLIDIEGNKYATIKIGEQIWMKENLKVTLSADSTQVESSIYNNDTLNLESHGRLYSWDAAMNGSREEKAQGICPNGWHIPSDEEIKILEITLGMTRQEADISNNWRGEQIGTQLKINGTSGFDVTLSGRCSGTGSFSFIDRVGYLWTSSESSDNYAWRRCLDKYASDVGRYNTFPKSYGFSIRCIKNDD